MKALMGAFMRATMKKFLTGLLGSLLSLSAFANEPLPILTQDEFVAFAAKADTVVIDVRTPREYNAGHIPGAINLPHGDIISGELTFDQFIDKNIVLYCHTGVRVGIVNQYLHKNPSFPREQISHLLGDFRAWQARGRPIHKP